MRRLGVQPAHIETSALTFAERYLPLLDGRPTTWRRRTVARTLLACAAEKIIISAARGAGTTTAVMARVLSFALTNPNSKILLVAPYHICGQRAFETLDALIAGSPQCQQVVTRRTTSPRTMTFQNGSRITSISAQSRANTCGEQPYLFVGLEFAHLSQEQLDRFMPIISSSPSCLIEYGAQPMNDLWECVNDRQDWQRIWVPARHMIGITFSGNFTIDDQGFPLPGDGARIHCTAVLRIWTAERDENARELLGNRLYSREIIARP